jgi:hypothetical protein
MSGLDLCESCRHYHGDECLAFIHSHHTRVIVGEGGVVNITECSIYEEVESDSQDGMAHECF